MKTCAFCPTVATLTGEHLFSDWTNRLYPSKRYAIHQRGETGDIIRTWKATSIDIKAKVVCNHCNNGWMSDLENNYARPVMTEMIVNGKRCSLQPNDLASIAVVKLCEVSFEPSLILYEGFIGH